MDIHGYGFRMLAVFLAKNKKCVFAKRDVHFRILGCQISGKLKLFFSVSSRIIQGWFGWKNYIFEVSFFKINEFNSLEKKKFKINIQSKKHWPLTSSFKLNDYQIVRKILEHIFLLPWLWQMFNIQHKHNLFYYIQKDIIKFKICMKCFNRICK